MIKMPQAIMSAVLISFGLVFATGCGPSKEGLRLQTEAKRLEEERAASAKAEAEAKAALEAKLAERTKVITEVLEFLNSSLLRLTLSATYVYKNFAYNAELESLEFVEFVAIGGSIGATGTATKWRLFLREARPVLATWRDEGLPHSVRLRLEGRVGYTSLDFAGRGDAQILAALETVSSEDRQQAIMDFWLSEDMAPRVKTALEDLLRVHGISPSRY